MVESLFPMSLGLDAMYFDAPDLGIPCKLLPQSLVVVGASTFPSKNVVRLEADHDVNFASVA